MDAKVTIFLIQIIGILIFIQFDKDEVNLKKVLI